MTEKDKDPKKRKKDGRKPYVKPILTTFGSLMFLARDIAEAATS